MANGLKYIGIKGNTDLAKYMAEIMEEYSADVQEAVNTELPAIAQEAIVELEEKAPKRTGKYSQSFRLRKETSASGWIDHVTIYSEKYRIAHLLENGHAKRGGGRVEGIAHWKPAEEFIEKTITDKVERAIKNVS